MRKTSNILFGLLCAAHLVALGLQMPPLVQWTKPLLMPTLALWLALETRDSSRFLRTAWLSGLAFSTLGDVLLMFPGDLYFMLGLGAFLLAHLFYIGGLWSCMQGRPGLLRRQPLWALPFLAYLLGLLYWLWPGIPAGMRLPVALYGVVISVMAMSAAHLKGVVGPGVLRLLFWGALLFVLSDSLIALGKFGGLELPTRLAVMVTYLAGQFLLAQGVRRVLQN
jgi:uncharacterized membrane protein YhhN